MRTLVQTYLGAVAVANSGGGRRSVFSGVRSAYRNGGAKEVLRRSRVRLARWVYPGELVLAEPPSKKKKKKAKSAEPVAPARDRPAPAVVNAVDVTYEQAMAFWERRRPTYERLVRWVAPYIGVDDLVLDVGGNTGYFSLVLGELTGLRGTVHLYEPVPHLAELCELTLRDAPFRVVVHPYGLAEESTTTRIFLSAHGNLGWNTLVAEQTQKEMTEIPIEIKVFDPRSLEKPPSFVKIDVEGAEHRVLRGMWAALESWPHRPVILCEIGWGTGHPDWDEELILLNRLVDELGYCAEGADGGAVDLSTIDRTTDVLFVPADRQGLPSESARLTGVDG